MADTIQIFRVRKVWITGGLKPSDNAYYGKWYDSYTFAINERDTDELRHIGLGYTEKELEFSIESSYVTLVPKEEHETNT